MDEQTAKNRVAALAYFYKSLGIYIAVNIIIIIINLVVSPHNLWFFWISIFWGIGVAYQAMAVFNPIRKFTQRWKENKVKELMDKDDE